MYNVNITNPNTAKSGQKWTPQPPSGGPPSAQQQQYSHHAQQRSGHYSPLVSGQHSPHSPSLSSQHRQLSAFKRLDSQELDDSKGVINHILI